MKPDWKDAPEWAGWTAMDSDGEWYWYENKPTLGFVGWNPTGGQCYRVWPHDWSESLTQRPETSGTTSGGAP